MLTLVLDHCDVLQGSPYCQKSQRGELDCINIRHPLFHADILLQGAQLLHFAPTGQSNWLWLSEQAIYQTGVAVRGGMPICWPWFGNALDNPTAVQQYIRTPADAPAHGFARVRAWQLRHVHTSAQEVCVTLVLPVSDHPTWLGQAQVEVVFRLSEHHLQVALTTHARAQPIVFSQALHSYFSTDDIHHTMVEGFDGQPVVDALQQWQATLQQGAVRFTEETDRIYQAVGWQRLITPKHCLLLRSNSRSAVVWNPWIDKSARLSQCAPDAWRRMCCIETANVLDDIVQLEAGKSFTLTLSIQATRTESGSVSLT